MSDVKKKTQTIWRVARHASVGLEMGIAVTIGALGGWWLDNRYGWSPWAMVGGTLIGVAAAFRGLYRAAMAARQQANESVSPEEEQGPNGK